MILLLIALALMTSGGLAGLLVSGRARVSRTIGVGTLMAGCLLGLVPAIRVLLSGREEALIAAWAIPLGSFSLGLDGLSAFFLVPLFVLGATGALYGALEGRARAAGASRFFYALLVASMALVVLARNGILFLIPWEVMAVASFFLVMTESGRPDVRRAGWIYLVASHIGTAFLFVLFVMLGRGAGTLDFPASVGVGVRSTLPGTVPAAAIFLLALAGFGAKAGFFPFHVWLPEAHPAAPSHVSALMSGVMIKMGIYGLLRVLMMLGPPPPWWGWTLVAIGALSGLFGVLFALAQHDLKRLLAYHSVENIGIIGLGIGIGLLGRSYGQPLVAFLGFAGALLHVVNHALFKGLLFLSGGAAVHAAHTRDIDRLGGLLRRMPWTGAAFLVGSVAICGLPPLNGFVSELLIYLGAFSAAIAVYGPATLAGIVVILSLALIGGLAVACFTKAFGIVFLGEPRCAAAGAAREADRPARIAMAVPAAGCAAIGLAAPWVVRACSGVFRTVAGISVEEGSRAAAWSGSILGNVVIGSGAMIALVLALSLLRRRWARRAASGPTWDCGYAAPTPSMQYTASSYAAPLTGIFGFAVRTRRHFRKPEGLFPEGAELATHTPDPVLDEIFAPAFAWVGRLSGRLRWVQGGRIQLYVLYIALTLLALLVWKLR